MTAGAGPMTEPGMILATAFVTTTLAAVWLARRAGLDPRAAYSACLAGILGALIGGQLWGQFLVPAPAVASRMSLDLLGGTKGVLGAAIGGAVAAAVLLRATGHVWSRYADAMVPAVFLGYAIARLACLAEGHVVGTPTDLPWGVAPPTGVETHVEGLHAAAGALVAGAPVHPVAVYHLLAGLLLAVLTYAVRRSPGGPMILALTGYGTARFFLEFVRMDAVPVLAGLSAPQVVSLLFAGAGIAWALTQVRRRTAASPAAGRIGSSIPVLR